MGRSHDITLPATTPWLQDPASQHLCAVIEAGGFAIYFVGGCVRNALLSADISDVDLSTNALPQTVMDLAKNAGFKAIPTGIDHGTVTVVIDGEPFEITTFRKDVETDGRRAVVTFSDSMEEDARRRDFTMNALYADAQGRVYDPLGGVPDARAGRVRFIDDADQRIREDYLRILRFFRFNAWYGDPAAGFDADALAAVAGNLDGLAHLSAERIGAELIKLLNAPDPAPAVAVMRQTGVLAALLSGADDRWLAPLVHMEAVMGLAPDPMRRLAILGGADVSARLRLSKAQSKTHEVLTQGLTDTRTPRVLGYLHGAAVAKGIVALRAAMFETPPSQGVADEITEGACAEFPVSARDLQGAFEGAALGAKLKDLKAKWIASDFTLSRSELLAQLPG